MKDGQKDLDEVGVGEMKIEEIFGSKRKFIQ